MFIEKFIDKEFRFSLIRALPLSLKLPKLCCLSLFTTGVRLPGKLGLSDWLIHLLSSFLPWVKGFSSCKPKGFPIQPGGEGVEWKSNELQSNYLPVLALRGDGPPSSLLGESRGKCQSRICPITILSSI